MTPRYKNSDRQKVKEDTRKQLLQAAAGEIAQYGYDRANVNRIAEAAGFSIGTIYNYFPSKRDLMNAFIESASQMHVDFVENQVKLVDEPGQKIVAFFKAGFLFIESHTTQAKAIFNILNWPDEEFRIRLFEGYQPLFQLLINDVIEQGIAQGKFREVEPASTAALLMLIYLGTGSQLNREGNLWMNYRQVADFVLHSLSK